MKKSYYTQIVLVVRIVLLLVVLSCEFGKLSSGGILHLFWINHHPSGVIFPSMASFIEVLLAFIFHFHFCSILQFLYGYVVLFFNSTDCSCCSCVSFSILHLFLHSNRLICFILCLYSVKCVDIAFLSISALYCCVRIWHSCSMSLVHHLEGIELHWCFLKPSYCDAPCLPLVNSSSCS